jgi:hypothetical protein
MSWKRDTSIRENAQKTSYRHRVLLVEVVCNADRREHCDRVYTPLSIPSVLTSPLS